MSGSAPAASRTIRMIGATRRDDPAVRIQSDSAGGRRLGANRCIQAGRSRLRVVVADATTSTISLRTSACCRVEVDRLDGDAGLTGDLFQGGHRVALAQNRSRPASMIRRRWPGLLTPARATLGSSLNISPIR